MEHESTRQLLASPSALCSKGVTHVKTSVLGWKHEFKLLDIATATDQKQHRRMLRTTRGTTNLIFRDRHVVVVAVDVTFSFCA